MEEKKRKLRKGFTTGTCAAAGAKAAALALFAAASKRRFGKRSFVEVTLPGGRRVRIKVKDVRLSDDHASATVVKDAGDDPDVTNGADIIAEVRLLSLERKRPVVRINGGEGVGVVTRPGLKVRPGRPAINPVPLAMIKTSVLEAALEAGVAPSVSVTVLVPKGRALAEKTMNPRLGIIGGISILGTTGIVEPLSLSAYRHSITCGIDVALASGSGTVVFSTGRTSERAVEQELELPPVAYILTGDHMGFALKDAGARSGLKRIIVAGQFGKFTKLAAGHFETHCSDAEVELGFIAKISKDLGVKESFAGKIKGANTAREAFFILKKERFNKVFRALCQRARDNARAFVRPGLMVSAVLVGYDNDIISTC